MDEKLEFTNKILLIIQATSIILMFANKAMFWGTISFMIAVFFQCLLILGTINSNEAVTIMNKVTKMFDKGIFMFIYILIILGIYVSCIAHSKTNIAEDEMPYQWTWYARIISVILGIGVAPILNTHVYSILNPQYKPENIKINQQNGFIVGHVLLVFVYIQYIISFYYQTDGFTV